MAFDISSISATGWKAIGVIVVAFFIYLIFSTWLGKRVGIISAKQAYFTSRAQARYNYTQLKRDVDLKKVFPVVLLSIGILYTISLLATSYLGIDPIKIGWVLMLFIVGGVIFLSYKMLFSQESLAFDNPKVWITILFNLAILLTLFFFLPKSVPQMFSVALPMLKTTAMSALGMI